MSSNNSRKVGQQLLYDALDLFTQCDSSEKRLPRIDNSRLTVRSSKLCGIEIDMDNSNKLAPFSATLSQKPPVNRQRPERLLVKDSSYNKNGLVIKPYCKSLSSLASKDWSFTDNNINIDYMGVFSSGKTSNLGKIGKKDPRCNPGTSLEDLRSPRGDKRGNTGNKHVTSDSFGPNEAAALSTTSSGFVAEKGANTALANDVIDFDPDSHSQYVETLRNLAPIWLVNPGAHPKEASHCLQTFPRHFSKRRVKKSFF